TDSGLKIGAALVEAHFTNPRTLSRTVGILHSRLLSDLEAEFDGHLPAREQRSRLAAVLGEVSAGYAQALMQRTLHEQEQISRAAISARAKAEDAMRASEARFRALFASAGTGIGVASVDGKILDVNQALANMLGYHVDELRRRRISDLSHPSDRSEIWPRYVELITGGRDQFRAKKRCLRQDGGEVWADLSASLIRDDNGEPQYVVVVMIDITDREQLHQRLHRQALHDPLTQLPNRMRLLDRLHEVFETARPGGRIGLCYLDLDGFKAVNDSIGHEVGDELLLRLANRLHELLAPAGHLVSRIGGDEFVILINDCQGSADAVAVAESVLEVVREPVFVNGHQLRVTGSVGVVEQPLSGADPAVSDPAALMRAADITLSRAKSNGKDRWALFDTDRNEREVTRHTLAATMPAALTRGEFTIAYQPIVELATGRPIGAEALVQWNHPKYGLLQPAQFMTLAERTGLVDQLGRWTLRQACQQAAAWTRRQPELAPLVSVNVSARQMGEIALLDDLHSVLSASGLPAAQLQLELSENTAMGFAESGLIDNLRTVTSIGVRLAVDGFGVGHSNLGCLRQLPVQGLKIAGAFIEGLRPPPDTDPVDEDLVATMISLAGRLGLDVTAEGVATKTQMKQLRAMGCPAGQGDFFGPAGPADDFERRLRRAAASAAGSAPGS
ncbi:MAG: putative bifunctional diguanylate cyclase/phosphodiesterase, partial [Micromonosporaceae bacterium]